MKKTFITLISFLCLSISSTVANAADAQKGDVCCTIIAIDGEHQIVYSRHQETGEVLQFQVDRLDIRSLRIGDMVGATFEESGTVVTSIAGAERNYTSVVTLPEDWRPTHSIARISDKLGVGKPDVPKPDWSDICCPMTPNPELVGSSGRLFVNAPEGVANFLVEVFKAGTTEQTTYWYGNKKPNLLPNSYDVVVNGVKLENVQVGRRMDTRIRCGALRVNLNDNSLWELFDTSKINQLNYAYGSKTIILPIGKYSVKMTGGFQEVEIKDGVITSI